MAKQEKTAAELYREERKARIAKAAKKNQKKSSTAGSSKKVDKIFAIVAVIAILVGIGAFVLNLIGVKEQFTTAFKVGDVKVSQAEYNYYYSNMYSRVYQYVNYGYDIGYNSSMTPDVQEYNGALGTIKDFPEDQKPMWTDYLEYSAKQNVAVMKAALNLAEEQGIKLDDADKADIQKSIDEMKESAENNNYSLGAYLKASCGKGVTKAMFKRILEEQKIYEKVINNKMDELKPTFTDSEVDKAFNDSLQEFAVVSYRSYTVKPATVEVKDEESGETKNEATDETKAQAKADADKLAAAKNADEFVAIVKQIEEAKGTKDYDASKTLTSDADINTLYYSANDSEVATWAFSKDAKINTVKTATADDGSITVVMIVDPAHKAPDALNYDVRHILVKFPEEETEKSDEAKEEVSVETINVKDYKDVTIDLNVDADSAKDKATYKKAQDILVEYLTGDKTSESFASLAEKYSEDVDSEGKINSEGGLYENVTEGQMVPQFEKWALEKGRKEGDVGIVETTYGYHIMYFVGSKVVTWDDAVRTHIAEEKVSEYQEELVADESVAITAVNEKALDKVEASIIKLARNQITNAANQTGYQN